MDQLMRKSRVVVHAAHQKWLVKATAASCTRIGKLKFAKQIKTAASEKENPFSRVHFIRPDCKSDPQAPSRIKRSLAGNSPVPTGDTGQLREHDDMVEGRALRNSSIGNGNAARMVKSIVICPYCYRFLYEVILLQNEAFGAGK
jgi:hypothetical protein